MKSVRALTTIFVLPILGAAGSQSCAQSYPAKPVRIIVGSAAGGNTDLAARLYAQKLTDALGQPTVVDIRVGASGAIASAYVAKSTADGYTLLLASTQFLITPILSKSANYHPLKDFSPIILVSQAPAVLLVHPSLPVRSVAQLIDLAKAKPAALSYGSGGIGTSNYLAAELFKAMAQVDILHIPYKGAAPAVTGLLGGEIHVAFPVLNSALGHLKSGRLRALGVSSVKRAAAAPDIPTITDSGLRGYETSPWAGLVAPAGTPRGVVERLNAVLEKVFSSSAGRDQLMAEGAEFVGGTPEQFGAAMQSEFDKWTRILKAIGISAESGN